MTSLLLVLASFLPTAVPVTDYADVVEWNHFHDDKGREVFQQYIWWDFQYDGYRVVDWRLVSKVGMRPVKTGQGYVLHWYDEKTDMSRRVVSRVFRETWTIDDWELADREVLPECKRRKLRSVETSEIAGQR